MLDILDRSKRGWFTRFTAELDEEEDEDDEAIVVFEAAIVEVWVAAAVACSDTMKKNFTSKIN